MSLRPQSPPPLPPLPPSPKSHDSHTRPKAPRARPYAQWPSRPSKEVPDAAVYPVKAPRKPQAPAPAPAPPAPETTRTFSKSDPRRRSSLASLSLNRFSIHRSARAKPAEVPPVPSAKPTKRPSSSSSSRRASTRGRAVQRKAHGMQEGSELSSHTPALQKKRSFFRRVADRLTRSRTSLRDDYRTRRASVRSEAAILEVPAVPQRAATLPSKAFTPAKVDRPPESTLALPPTPTSTTASRKARHRPPSIKVQPQVQNGPVSPAGVPLPPSRADTLLTPTSPASLRQPTSTISARQPPSPTSLRQPPSPTSARQPTSPTPSIRQASSSGSTKQHPAPSTPPPGSTTPRSIPGHHTAPASSRHAPPASSPGADPVNPPTTLNFPLPPQGQPVRRRETYDSDRQRERGIAPNAARRGGYLPGTAEGNEDEEEEADDDDEEEERRASEMKVSRWLATPESPTESSSLDHSHSPSLSHSQSSHSHSQSHSGSTGLGRLFGGGFGGIDEEDVGARELDAWRGAVMEEEEVDVLPEVERMALEAEERTRARGVVPATSVAAGDARKTKKTAGRQLSLFGRRKGKDGVLPALRPRAATVSEAESAAKNRRSPAFRSPSPALSPASVPLPTSPTSAQSPTQARSLLAPPSTNGIPTATPRPRKLGVDPTMHTRGSILLETRDIADPESRRLSEMVFLT